MISSFHHSIFIFRNNRIETRQGNPLPKTCFDQVSAEYIDNKLVTTFMVDTDGWTIVNDVDDVVAVAVAHRQDVMSIGTAGFIASMEDELDGSGGTVVEVASPAALADLQK